MSNEIVSELYNDYRLSMNSIIDSSDFYGHIMGAINSGKNKYSLFNR